MTARTTYLLTWSGSPEEAQRALDALYPGSEIVTVSKRELRERGWRGQISFLRGLHGDAFVIYCRRREDIHEPQLLSWATLLHRCQRTVFLDATGAAAVVKRSSLIRGAVSLLPGLAQVVRALLGAWLRLSFWRNRRRVEVGEVTSRDGWELAYLYPFPLDRGTAAGGANAHVNGLLSALAGARMNARIFSSRAFEAPPFPVCEVPQPNASYLLKEARLLAYNRHFHWAVRGELRKSTVLYQRHGRFVYAGAMLAKALRAPLVLEYNGSEEWVARHWDPSRFGGLLRRCEQVSLNAASLIVVVSDVLRDELIARGIPASRILVNPNGFEAARFQPGCGGAEMRARLQIAPGQVVVTFVGSFSYWHGVGVLAEAIRRISNSDGAPAIRFLLVGEGPFAAEMRESLKALGERVIFTGMVPHGEVPAYLDASDILCSPHVRMPDGRRFFGSPTKLFEYMGMQKAIVASRLDQLEQVLDHGESALLVEPGDADQLAEAILVLARDAGLRSRLGTAARRRALEQYTWQHNAERLLHRLRQAPRQDGAGEPVAVPLASTVRAARHE